MAAGSLALYRKYRSANFAELIGQEHVTNPLIQALSSGRINHAYLFSGPRGCGKTSSARILARSINCAQGPTPTPCGVCESCLELAPNGSGSIDVIEIDAASHGGVDDARDLRERAFYAPARDRYKVYVIDEAHMVSKEGFNALLKLVEEPPEFLIFIFATTEPDKVLQTIRSRTHHYPFRLVPPAVLRAHLERICAAEGVQVEPAVFPLIVRAGGGSVRDSLSILDQLLAGAGPEGVRYAEAVALLGVTDAALLDNIVDALAAGDAASVYGAVERVIEGGHDPRRFGADLLDRFRDLLVLDAVPDAGERGLIDVPADELARMRVQGASLGGATLTRFGEIVHAGLVEMRGTTSPRLLLELLCARMLVPDAGSDVAAVMQRLERVERRIEIGSAQGPPSPVASAPRPAPMAPSSAPTAEPARRPAAPATGAASAPDVQRSAEPPARPAAAQVPAEASAAVVTPEPVAARPAGGAGPLDASALRALWPEVLSAANGIKKRTGALLQSAAAQVQSVDGQSVVITANTPVLARMLSDASNLDVVCEALSQVLPGPWRVSVAAAGDAAPPAAAPARTAEPSARTAEPPAPTAEPTAAEPPVAPSPAPASVAPPRQPAAPAPHQEPARRPAARPVVQSPAPASPRPEEPTPPSVAWPVAAVPGGVAAADAIPPGEPPESDDDYELTPPSDWEPRDAAAEAMALLRAELGARPIED